MHWHRHIKDWPVSSNATSRSGLGPLWVFVLQDFEETEVQKDRHTGLIRGHGWGVFLATGCSPLKSSLPHHKHRRWVGQSVAQPSGEENAQTGQGWMHRQDMPRCTDNTWPHALDTRGRRQVPQNPESCLLLGKSWEAKLQPSQLPTPTGIILPTGLRVLSAHLPLRLRGAVIIPGVPAPTLLFPQPPEQDLASRPFFWAP